MSRNVAMSEPPSAGSYGPLHPRQQHHVAAPALTRSGQERGLTGERPTVLLARGPGRGQRPVDEVAALVGVGAAARVEQDGVSVGWCPTSYSFSSLRTGEQH